MDTQEIWSDYYARKRAQRLQEAAGMWQILLSGGATEDTVIAIDFVHFGTKRDDIEHLAQQLSENYAVEVSHGSDGYWLVKGTSRPNGLAFTQDQHMAWVQFMCDVAQSYGCVFSTWLLDAPSIGVSASSEAAESDS